MRTNIYRSVLLAIVVLMLVVTVFTLFLITDATAQSSEALPQEIKTLLADYSQYLEIGKTAQKAHYSSQIDMLVENRREYYKEFFENGLHANLTSLDSQFVINIGIALTRQEDVYYLRLNEIVTMHGTPITISPEKYPLIQAADWAISQSDNVNVENALKQYIKTMTEGVNKSVHDGVEVVFVISHDIEIDTEKKQLQIIRDIFTDKSSDNLEGFDNVIWSRGEFLRYKPDWMKMPDYAMYNTSIETLGQGLLTDYSTAYAGIVPRGTGFYYQRSRAQNYINTYTSNPVTLCPGSSVKQDTSKYNSSYQSLWSLIGCNDCTDYVSQALRSGGFPLDSNWYPGIASYAWNVTDGLKSYLMNIGAAQWYNFSTSLQIGDIAFTSDYGHSIMVANVNPHRFSGHTNDRQNHTWSNSLTLYLHVKNYVP